MKSALLDTNVLIHREARKVIREDIGALFLWLDRLHYEKLIHPLSIEEIRKHADTEVVRTIELKLGSYRELKTLSNDTPEVAAIRAEDRTDNDRIDTDILAEVAVDRVDILISEDRGIHRKAARLGLATRVFTIDEFLEKANAEHPALADYTVLSVRKRLFGEVDLTDPFFDSFRADYGGTTFDRWFRRKADEEVYVCTDDTTDRLLAFLYVKTETDEEGYADIAPPLKPEKRLKIGTFKVVANGVKLGERFLKIVFDNALRRSVTEIYITLYKRTSEHERLARLLEEWGFYHHGMKASATGPEYVYVRDFRPSIDLADPRRTFPYMAGTARKFIVPIYPEYHTELFPDSILRGEDPRKYVDSSPARNAITKVYISRSWTRDLRRGDIIVFYRTASGGSAYHTAVATTFGIVLDVTDNIKSKADFIAICRKRSVFSDAELGRHWDYNPRSRPFVVTFLAAHSIPLGRRPNRRRLLDERIIGDEPPRGFVQLPNDAFSKLIGAASVNARLVVG